MRTLPSSKGLARRGSRAYLGASFVAQLCALGRYTVLARLLGPEQLGIAVAIILTVQFFESVSDSGSDRFLIQDKQGEALRVQRVVHLVWVGRGLLVAIALAALAGPIAEFFESPPLRQGMMIVALAPLIAAFVHLDYRRMQRRSDFRGEGQVLIFSEAASFAVTVIAAFLTRDFTAIIWGLITRSVVTVLVSHSVAKRRYAVGYAREHARRLAAFAVPLMFNGLLLFIGSQGDRALIGREVGLAALGYYSAALLLIYYPTGMLQRYIGAMHLPLIAAAAGDLRGQRAAEDRLGGQTLLLSVTMMVGYAIFAPLLIVLLFGPEFRLPVLLVAAIGVLQSARFLRLWPVTAALAHGKSGTVLASNLSRLIALPGAYVGLEMIGGLAGIVAGFVAGELAALAASLLLLAPKVGERMGYGLRRIFLFSLASALVIAWAAVFERPSSYYEVAALLLMTPVLLFLILRKEVLTLKEAMMLLRRRKHPVQVVDKRC